jgi:hypothetical protein
VDRVAGYRLAKYQQQLHPQQVPCTLESSCDRTYHQFFLKISFVAQCSEYISENVLETFFAYLSE